MEEYIFNINHGGEIYGVEAQCMFGVYQFRLSKIELISKFRPKAREVLERELDHNPAVADLFFNGSPIVVVGEKEKWL
jgi:hypothetical protein